MKIFYHYFLALRPHQWLKNFLLFIPLIATHQINNEKIFLSVLMFISFSFVASSVYIFNDLIDIAADKTHPRKKLRPFASKKIATNHGKLFGLLVLFFGITFGYYFISELFVKLILAYFIISTLYSFYFKQLIVIDICILAVLYTMRIIIGGLVLNIDLSVWLLVFHYSSSFLLQQLKDRQNWLIY